MWLFNSPVSGPSPSHEVLDGPEKKSSGGLTDGLVGFVFHFSFVTLFTYEIIIMFSNILFDLRANETRSMRFD